MKKILSTIFIAIIILFSIEIQAQQKEISDSSTIDFNGDGQIEYMWLESAKIDSNNNCMGECDAYIRFSDTSLPSIFIKNTIGGTPTNLGNLNMRKGDEIGIMDMWFQGCTVGYHVFSYKNKKWINAVPEFYIDGCMEYDNADFIPIIADKRKKGVAIITYSGSDGHGNIIAKKKSVVVK